MRFISVRDLRGKSAQVWKRLEAEMEMVITSNGKPIAILSAVLGDRVEESLEAIRRARAMAAVASMQKHALEMGLDTMTLDEINAEIQAVRDKRPE